MKAGLPLADHMIDRAAIVVFHGHGDTCLSRLFGRAGFRHCFVAVCAGDCWIEIDGRTGVPRIKAIAAADFDLARHYRAQGFAALETAREGRVPLTPLMLCTCVGAVKRILGIRAFWVLTPWRLYRYLRARKNERGRSKKKSTRKPPPGTCGLENEHRNCHIDYIRGVACCAVPCHPPRATSPLVVRRVFHIRILRLDPLALRKP